MQTGNGSSSKAARRPDKVTLAKRQLASDFSALVSDAEELLKSTASYSEESVNAARDRFKGTLDEFKGRISDAQDAAVGKWNDTAAATNGYVHDNPWRVVGAAAVVGVIVGVLMHRR
jgi:ElaB/YqjD/DUF883 family membrane-anchored ribosome-binding protein